MKKQSIHTILAGLRMYQLSMTRGRLWEIEQIATNGGQFAEPTEADIDALCEELNCQPDESIANLPFVFAPPTWANTSPPASPEEALKRADELARSYYALGAQTGIHSMIEWCGVMTEYVKMLTVAAEAGIDPSHVDQHHKDCAVSVPDFMRNYFLEKLGCQLKPFIRADAGAWRRAIEDWFEGASLHAVCELTEGSPCVSLYCGAEEAMEAALACAEENLTPHDPYDPRSMETMATDRAEFEVDLRSHIGAVMSGDYEVHLLGAVTIEKPPVVPAHASYVKPEQDSFEIGDTVRIKPNDSSGNPFDVTGIIVGIECWADDDKAVVWNGIGEPPVFAGKVQPPGRFLLRLRTVDSSEQGSLARWFVERSLKSPHDFPFVAARDLELISRPSVSFLNDSGCDGSVRCFDANGKGGVIRGVISRSRAEALEAMAWKKVARECPPIAAPAAGNSSKITMNVIEVTEMKVADTIYTGFRFFCKASVEDKISVAKVVEIQGRTAKIEVDNEKSGVLLQDERGWFDQLTYVRGGQMTKFVITYINREGQRQLFGPNQGRCFKLAREDAEGTLREILASNDEKKLSMILGPQAIGTFEVRPVECYASGDAQGIYFDDPFKIKLVRPNSRFYNVRDARHFERGPGGKAMRYTAVENFKGAVKCLDEHSNVDWFMHTTLEPIREPKDVR